MPPPDPNRSATSDPGSSLTVERFAAWVLPLTAVAILLVGVWKAIGAGELRWMIGGLIVYSACLVLWLALTLMRRARSLLSPLFTSAVSPPSRPAIKMPSGEQPLPVREMISFVQDILRPRETVAFREAVVFARYAIWVLPYLAVVCLIYANTRAALSDQQRWVTTSLLSFAGSFVAWMVHLSRPWVERSKPVSQPASGMLAPGGINEFATAVLPFLSLLVLATSLFAAANASQIRWLTAGTMTFCGYLAIVVLLWLRSSYLTGTPQPPSPDPVLTRPVAGISLQANWAVRLAMPAIALAALAGDFTIAARFHQLSWTTTGLVVSCACMAVWFVQMLGFSQASLPASSALSSSPPTVPALLLCAMLVLLGIAAYRHEISVLETALLAIVGGLALWFSWIFVASVARDGPPQIESNWGGLGGGIGGWRFSESLVYGLCTLTLVVCTSFAFLAMHEPATGTNGTLQPASVTKPLSSSNPGSESNVPIASSGKEEPSAPGAKTPEK